MRFDLGEILRDKITGFQGVAMGKTEYFTDCIHYGLCSQQLKDGKPIDWEWFDETRLIRVTNIKKIIRESREPTMGSLPKKPTSGSFPKAPSQ